MTIYINNENFLETIKSLLDSGVDVNKTNQDGETLLHISSDKFDKISYIIR